MLIGAERIGKGNDLADERKPVLAENDFTIPTLSVKPHIEAVEGQRRRNLGVSICSRSQRIQNLHTIWTRFNTAIV
jgi:hypothetical protein